MREHRAADGGFYLPYRIPKLSTEDLRSLRGMTPCERVLSVTRRFLRMPDRILEADGMPVRMNVLADRMAVCEIFPAGSGSFRGYTDEVSRNLFPDGSGTAPWLAVSIRIGAIAAAVIGYQHRNRICTDSRVDISMVSGDLFGPMSAYLAREMGIPVGDILCCCNENSGFWEFLHHGEFRTDHIAVMSGIPEADLAVPDGLECLIALCCGREEAVRYLDAVRAGKTYVPGEECLDRLKSEFHATVVTRSGLMRGGYISRGVPVKAGTAMALAGLLDHRSGKCLGRPALIIAE